MGKIIMTATNSAAGKINNHLMLRLAQFDSAMVAPPHPAQLLFLLRVRLQEIVELGVRLLDGGVHILPLDRGDDGRADDIPGLAHMDHQGRSWSTPLAADVWITWASSGGKPLLPSG